MGAYLAGCAYPPVPEGVVIYSTVGLTANGSSDNDTSTADAMVFPHKAVLSFGCLAGYRANNAPPQGKPFHTLACTKREWKGSIPVCNGECIVINYSGVHAL